MSKQKTTKATPAALAKGERLEAPAPDNQPDNQPTKGTAAMNEQGTTNANEPAAPAPDAVDAPAPAKGETPAPAAKRAPAKGKPAPAPLVVSLTEAAGMLGQSPTEVRRWERMGAMPPLVKLPTRGTGKARRLYWRTADIVSMVDGLTASAGGR